MAAEAYTLRSKLDGIYLKAVKITPGSCLALAEACSQHHTANAISTALKLWSSGKGFGRYGGGQSPNATFSTNDRIEPIEFCARPARRRPPFAMLIGGSHVAKLWRESRACRMTAVS